MIEPSHNGRRRLLLISARTRFKHHENHRELALLAGKRLASFTLALPVVASLTPPHWDVRIVDDENEPLPEEKPDLVGLTVMASNVARAFEIADHYRAQGVPVVMGGSYASFMVEESLQHATSVVIGEAEGAWEPFLADFERGEAKRTYQVEERVELDHRPRPRWDLLDSGKLLSVTCETARGCPFDCAFCVVPRMYGRKVRYRAVDDVVAELEGLPLKTVLFTDDNFAANTKRTRELLAALKPLGISWVCQCDIKVAEQPDLLREMAEAGCHQLLIGFESLDAGSLTGMGKAQNRAVDYAKVVEAVHAAGIQLVASFIVGFEDDTPASFDRIFEFVQANHILFPMVTLLAVLPGTPLFKRLQADGTLLPMSYGRCCGVFPTARAKTMSQVQLSEHYFALLERIFAWENVLARATALFSKGYYKRTNPSADVHFWQKVTIFARLLRRYHLGASPAQRALFRELFRIGRTGVAAMDEVVMFLMSALASQDYLKNAGPYLAQMRPELEADDRRAEARVEPPAPTNGAEPRTPQAPEGGA